MGVHFAWAKECLGYLSLPTTLSLNNFISKVCVHIKTYTIHYLCLQVCTHTRIHNLLSQSPSVCVSLSLSLFHHPPLSTVDIHWNFSRGNCGETVLCINGPLITSPVELITTAL